MRRKFYRISLTRLFFGWCYAVTAVIVATITGMGRWSISSTIIGMRSRRRFTAILIRLRLLCIIIVCFSLFLKCYGDNRIGSQFQCCRFLIGCYL